MQISLGISITNRLKWGFTPASLFAGGENGAWFEARDTDELFTTDSGETAVTAASPVGLALSNDQGLVLGPELVTNGTFDINLTGWIDRSNGDSSVVWDNGTALFNFGGTGKPQLAQGLTNSANSWVAISYVLSSESAVVDIVNNTDGNSVLRIAGSQNQVILNVSSANVEIEFSGLDDGESIDNVSVRELPGNHATATGSARPTWQDTPPHILDDLTDDALTWDAPAGTYTVARVNSFGTVTIQTGQALSGSTDILLEETIAGYVAVDRALTSAETSSLTAYLEGLV